MKKLFTLFAAVICSMTMMAQKPVPTFSALATDGNTIQYLYNVEAGGFLLGANDWSTRASVSTEKGYQFKVKANGDGTYTLNDYVDTKSAWLAVFADNGSSIWVDNLEGKNVNKWQITQKDRTTFNISNSAAATGLLGVDPTLADSRLYINETVTGTTWAAVSADDYTKYFKETLPAYNESLKKTDDKTVDLASLFPELLPSGLASWTCEGTVNGEWHTNTWSTEGATDGSNMTTPFFERWVGSGAKLNPCKMYVVLKGLLPNSTYEASALFRILYENGGVDVDKVNFFIGANSVDICENGTPMNKGKYGTFSVKGKTDAEGNLTIGVEVLEGTNASWVTWKNMTLKYFGETVDRSKLSEAIDVAAEYAKTSTSADKINDAIQDAIDVLDKADATQSDIDAALLALNKVLADAKTIDAAGNEVLPLMKKLTESTNVYTQEALNTYYTQWQDKFDEGILTTSEAAALQNPYATTGWHANLTVDDLLLSTWSIGDKKCQDYSTSLYINTWSAEGNSDGSEFKTPFFEYWTGDANSLGANQLKAEMTGLHAGKYNVSALVRVRLNNNSVNDQARGIFFHANEGESVDACLGEQIGTSQFRMMTVNATCEVTEDGLLDIMFDVDADNNISWFSFKDVNYTYVPQITESVEYTYQNYSDDFVNYEDTDWGLVNGVKINVDFYDNNTFVIHNWMNLEGYDLHATYDPSTGYVTAVDNPYGKYAGWAYCGPGASYDYYSYVNLNNTSWVSSSHDQIYLGISFNYSTWYNYNLKYVEPTPEPTTVDLTEDMFHHWTAADATGEISGTPFFNGDMLNKSTQMVYGNSNVSYLDYADLTGYKQLVITTTEGAPRCLFDRVVDNGTVQAETPRDAKYFTQTTAEGVTTITIDLAAIKTDYGFVHLHAIKGANWANTTVTSMKLVKDETTTSISNAAVATVSSKAVKTIENGRVVIVKNGKKYNVAGALLK